MHYEPHPVTPPVRPTHPTADTQLDAARQRCDPLADAAVVELAGSVMPGGLLAACQHAAASGEAPACARLLETSERLPRWVDFDAMRAGRELFMRHGTLGLLLGFTVLVDSYAGARDNKVLVMSGRLASDGAMRRLAETAVFVLRVVSPDGLRPGGVGYEAALEVRLLHARVRQLCRRAGYDTASYDEPINQEAMCGTLMLFSHGLLVALERLGVCIEPDERQAWHELWRCVGWLLGVDEALLMPTWRMQARLYDRIKDRQYHPDDTTTALFRAAVDGVADSSRERLSALTGRWALGSQTFLRQLTLLCVDPVLSRHLDLQPCGLWPLGFRVARPLLRARSRLLRRAAPLGRLAARLQRLVTRAYLQQMLEGASVHFDNPGFARAH